MSIIHPIIIRDTRIPSNVFFAPINPGYSENGLLTKKLITFHINHSGKGIGIYYVGNISMRNIWASNSNTVVLSTSGANTWKKLSSNISATGSIPGIQLAWKPEAIAMQRSFITDKPKEQLSTFREFYSSVDDINYLASIYVDSINRAKSLGFKVIQLHAAHGYALSLLLSRSVSGCVNPIHTKGVKLIKTILNNFDKKDCILDIRISLYEGIDDTQEELNYKMSLFNILSELGFDIISLSNGFYNIDKRMIYPPKRLGPIILEEAISCASKYPNIIWNVSGNMERILTSTRNMPSNLSFSIGRQLIADPETIVKIQHKAIGSIDWCSECGSCHYYSYNLGGIQPCKLTL